MNRDQLRQLQQPWKDRFRNDPASALVELHARGTLRPEELVCELAPRAGGNRTGLHPFTGGDGSKSCAAEMLLDSLIGCAGVTLLAVATSMEVPIESGEVEAAGELDFRGTLGVDRSAPVGFQSIRLKFRLRTSASDEQLTQLVRLTERYCVVYQTLRESTRLSSEAELIQD